MVGCIVVCMAACTVVCMLVRIVAYIVMCTVACTGVGSAGRAQTGAGLSSRAVSDWDADSHCTSQTSCFGRPEGR